MDNYNNLSLFSQSSGIVGLFLLVWIESMALAIDLPFCINNSFGFQNMRMDWLRTILVVFCLACLGASVVDRTYYIYLGLDISASQTEIQHAFEEKKAKITGLSDEEIKAKKMKLLQEAYSVLGNEGRRKEYDRFNKDQIKKDKLMASAKKITTDNYRKDPPIKLTLPVSVEDVYQGRTVEARFIRQTACGRCRGTGADTAKDLKSCGKCGGDGFGVKEVVNGYGKRMWEQSTCGVCQGSGKQVVKKCGECKGARVVEVEERVGIKIPRGLPDGHELTVRNFADESVKGAPGDLQVTIVEIPTEKWSRKKMDLIYTMEISLQDSIFGFSRHFTHLNGQQVTVTSKAVTKDSLVTFPRDGLHNPRTNAIGNLLVHFRIKNEKFTDRQLDMWEDFFSQHRL